MTTGDPRTNTRCARVVDACSANLTKSVSPLHTHVHSKTFDATEQTDRGLLQPTSLKAHSQRAYPSLSPPLRCAQRAADPCIDHRWGWGERGDVRANCSKAHHYRQREQQRRAHPPRISSDQRYACRCRPWCECRREGLGCESLLKALHDRATPCRWRKVGAVQH